MKQIEKKHFRTIFYRIFWLAIFAGYAATGLYDFKFALHTPKAGGSGALCGSDSLLRPVLGEWDGSQKLLDALAQMPPHGPMAVFWPEINPNGILAPQLVGYLAWPRKIVSVPANQNTIRNTSDFFNRPPFSARIYCFIKPPAPLPDGIAIGTMTIAPVAQGEK